MTWLPPPDRLTPAQTACVEASTDKPLVLRGGPGSGKTVVLLHRARRLGLATGRPDRVATLVYTNVLRDFIRSATEELKLPAEQVLTFDHWCRLRHVELIGPPPTGSHGHPDFLRIRQQLLEHLRTRSLPPALDAALVDEGQDLDEDCFAILRLSARHVTVAYDLKQSLYHEPESRELLRSLGPGRREEDLRATYRACPYVVDLACEFIADEDERSAFRLNVATLQTERQTPLLYLAADEADERRRLVEILRERLLRNERVAILFPTFPQVGLFAGFLRAQGIMADQQTQTDTQGRRPALDFSSGRPAVLTYHSAKGLTFDSVLMPGLTKSAIRARHSSVRRMLFVAVTRATHWAYLSSRESDCNASVLEAMRSLRSRQRATIQTKADLPRQPLPPPLPKPGDWTDI
jgi:superfamily I DNA/RNA helicase